VLTFKQELLTKLNHARRDYKKKNLLKIALLYFSFFYEYLKALEYYLKFCYLNNSYFLNFKKEKNFKKNK